MKTTLARLVAVSLFLALSAALAAARPPQPLAAAVPASQSLADTYRDAANRLIDAALADAAAWQRLARLTDTFGPRFSGTQNLEDAIDWILEEMERDGLDNVHGEPAMVPRWVRGEESAELVEPRPRALPMLGLGGSVATPAEGITAEVLVVRSFDDLEARAAEARGKIVLFNAPFTNYGQTVRYRTGGAVAAARAGAVASLIRSVTPYSQQTPHTGGMSYEEGVPRIPHAAITVEDADMLQRFQDRGERIVVRLKMSAQTLPDVRSRNVVAEIRGSELPDQVVVLGGHIDSWDVGQGAMDDGGGCVAAWEAVRLMKALGLRPRRTVRVVLWTNEENGLRGGNAYRDAHTRELDDHILAMESDGGVFAPTGFGFDGSDEALAILRRIATLLDRIGAGTINAGGGGADIGPIVRQGVPGMELEVDGTRYFWYHHTDADTMTVIDANEMARCVAALAVIAYVVADMPQRLPRSLP
ncbi:MAG: M28 family metallopeptidase [Acidobacteriota bacterium]